MRTFAATMLAASVALSVAGAQTTTNLIITPSYTNFDGKHIAGVALDAAPSFPYGSFASDGVAKTDMIFTPVQLFGREISVGDIAGFSYWTKKSTLHSTGNPGDWYVVIYTKKYAGQSVGWYGARIGSEPYLAGNLTENANQWNKWSTAGPTNKLRFFESTFGYFGSYLDPGWATFKEGNLMRNASLVYKDQPVLRIDFQTGSAWAKDFKGQLDGFRIELTDGSVATVNFEPFIVPSDAEACKKDGWTKVFRPDGSGFKNQGDCIQFVNTGK